jgi:SAM-dependent methyltransferase
MIWWAPPTLARTGPRWACSEVRRLLVGAACGLARTLDRGVTASTFLAAGLLRFADLERHMAANWRHFGLNQTEADVAAGLFQWEQEFYGRFLRSGDRVLVVGCGSGRDLVALLEQGYRAEGLEPVAACADLARTRVARRGLTATIHTADITTARLDERFDAVIFSWFCYSYIPLRARRLAVLGGVRGRLAPGGRILISYVRAQPAPRRLPWRLARLASRISLADWRPEYGDVFAARSETGRIHFEHRFAPAEIEAEAAAARLAVAFHEHPTDGNIALVIA